MISDMQKPLDTGLGAKPEPEEVMGDTDLRGKIALVTGGYSGIGLETVRYLSKAGADVYAPARDVERAKEVLKGIIPEENISAMDLGDVSSVRDYAKKFAAEHDKLDLIIANAGVMACPLQRTAQGWEWQMGVNHFGHFVLINALTELLINAGQARVVTLSSTGHRLSGVKFDDIHFDNSEYEKWPAYGQSKSAQSLFAVEMDRQLKDKGIRCFSVHPGGIFTPLQRHLPQEEMVALGWLDKNGDIPPAVQAAFKTPAQGAATSLWAAVSKQLDGMGGVYLEDCNIAVSVPDGTKSRSGVRAWAVDTEQARRLWEITVEQLASA